ncbi:MAG: PspC domain-containing protein [Anaerolineae bacterium]|nr:PspC domain-containing protein [Anaerolineae bacterium]
MLRSFTDRVLGGVCAGLAAALRINVWLMRLLFGLLTVVSGGAFALVYVLLWWLVPQESLIARRRGFPTIIAVLLCALTLASWFGRESLRAPSGEPLFWAAGAVILSAVFFLRQIV